MLEKNQIAEAVITDLTAEGNGVCRIDGAVVFVPDSAVGDRLNVRIVKVLKNYSFGIIDSIIEPSADRVPSDCTVSGKCGGCVFRHITYESECRIKDNIVRSAFERIGGLSPEFEPFMPCPETAHYRNKAQYPLGISDGKAVCGFYASRSHRIIPIESCPLQPTVFSEIVKVIIGYINERGLSIYDEKSGSGLLRHIYLRCGTHSGEIMVCIVARKDVSRQLSALCRTLSERFPKIVSVVLNINSDRTNVILGKKCTTLFGKDSITDTMCGNIISISPLSFYQVNTKQAERLYAKALEYAAPDGSNVLADLYCGAGTIGLSMAQKVKKLYGVEIIEAAVENARTNAEANGIANAEFFCGDAGKVFSRLKNDGCAPDIIVVDPPRKGCSQEALDAIIEASPDKIVMISCNPSTSARDAKFLAMHGYSVIKVCGVDMFPRTGHVECVVLMSKEKA